MKQRAKNPQKGPNDFFLGLIMFIAFIIFMALWLHFELPDSDQHAALNSGTNSADLSPLKH
jgi:hypothetical protein